MNKKTAPFFILTAGVCWGFMGVFVRKLENYDFSPLQIASIRIIIGGLLFFLITLIFDRSKLKINPKDIGWFLAHGLIGVLFFTIFYFKTISVASLSLAAILLYTAPIMVMIMSIIFFKEKINLKKIIAVIMAFAGCVLVTGIGGNMNVSVKAVGMGLLSGFGYALYSIIGTVQLKKYNSLTVTTYAFLGASVGAIFVCNPPDVINKIAAAPKISRLILLLIATVIVSVIVPYISYTYGLSKVKASAASIMASIEPVVATLVGFSVFKEKPSLVSIIGILLVLGAIAVININFKNQSEEDE
jgi:drug/metabolite transporter (DMT)-like permease